MTDLAKIVPARGGRVLLERTSSETDPTATYHVTLSSGADQWRGQLTVSGEPAVVSAELHPEAPGWLVDFAKAVLRTIGRRRDRQPWPRRIARWHQGPKETK